MVWKTSALLLSGHLLLLAQPDPQSLTPIYRQALADREKQFGAGHPKVAQSASDLALYLMKLDAAAHRDEATALLRRAASSRGLVEDLENLAGVLRPPDAIEILREAASKASSPETVARIQSRLGNLYERMRLREQAIECYRKALSLRESPARFNDLALLLEPRAAEPLLRRALTLQDPKHPEAAVTMNNLANMLLAQQKLAEAERLQRSALAILEAALGREHARVAVSCSNLADVLRAKGDAVGAKAFYRRALAIDEKVQPSEVQSDLRNLVEYLEELGEKAEAAKLRNRMVSEQ
jgi:tetratricopeptide (TPR) repeat protein